MDMYKYNTPQELFTAICDKIRDKIGSNELINHQDIPDKINKLMSDDIKLFIDSAIQGKNTIYYSFNNTTITKISNKIFSTTNLTTIDLPECTSIGNSAFSGCTNLTTVNLPKCTSIGSNAFKNCESLTTIDLPKCTSIGSNAFKNCESLTTIDLPKCTSIGEYAFSSCTNLTTIDLPECTSIGERAFNNCTSLTTIDLSKCTSIGKYAFYGCTSLATIDLPKCTSIDNFVFISCTNLTTIILSNNQVVTSVGAYAFSDSSIKNGTGYIYVPDNLVDSYKTATNWSSYANQIKPISELPSNLKEEYGYE